MKPFATLLDRLSYEPGRSAKVRLLSEYFEKSEDPHRALDALQRIGDQMEMLSPYEFSITVSDILRGYVTEQYQLPVTRQTSVEFLAMLAKSSPFSPEEASLLQDFLERCDLIKFARYDATPDDSRRLLEEAIQFVKGAKLEPA